MIPLPPDDPPPMTTQVRGYVFVDARLPFPPPHR
jgi:hypothetical protein